ncbi:hypothetical protein HPB48_009738 [Haemaphysalis longicornis]|uniref:Uncharacterized protein n=1 Tax=Haemaphysalis longicornis TaxID=44386 RepID=A0A9J6GEH3_HAELO|nr:hypothetical protein HPB48_009738 [Haemaphysalis longicornis]
MITIPENWLRNPADNFSAECGTAGLGTPAERYSYGGRPHIHRVPAWLYVAPDLEDFLPSLHCEAFNSAKTVKMAQLYHAEEDVWVTVLRKKAAAKELVLRPQDGFVLATHGPAALMMAIESAANLLQSEAKAIYIDVPHPQNNSLIKSLHDSASENIVRITGIYIGGQIRRVRIYATATEDSCRGIVPGIEAVHHPSERAHLTFRGTYAPRFVLYHRAKYDFKPHKPKAQFCFTCYGIRQQADICPQAGVIKCKACGSLLDAPDQEYACKLCCANCQAEHPADDPTCPAREHADSAASKVAYLKRVQARNK